MNDKPNASLAKLDACRERLSRVDEGVNREKYEVAADIFAEARRMSCSPADFAALAAAPVFAGRRKTRDIKDVLRLAFVYAYGSDKGPNYERACAHSRALQPWFADSNIEPEEIADLIEEHRGIDRLHAEVIAKEKREHTGFVVEATSEQLDEALNFLDEEGEAIIKIKRVEDGDNGWKRFVYLGIQ